MNHLHDNFGAAMAVIAGLPDPLGINVSAERYRVTASVTVSYGAEHIGALLARFGTPDEVNRNADTDGIWTHVAWVEGVVRIGIAAWPHDHDFIRDALAFYAANVTEPTDAELDAAAAERMAGVELPPLDDPMWGRLVADVMAAHPANEHPVIDLRDGKGVA